MEVARHQWLMPVILAAIRRIVVRSQPVQNSSLRPYLEKSLHKKGLVEWPGLTGMYYHAWLGTYLLKEFLN
jgi:hypothetical protein